jgi:hypothetical protein
MTRGLPVLPSESTLSGDDAVTDAVFFKAAQGAVLR